MRRSRFAFILLCLLFLLPSCSGDPAGTKAPADVETTGQIDPNASGDFSLGEAAAGNTDCRVVVWASRMVVSPDSISFDVVLRNTSHCIIAAPVRFIITRIQPNVVHVTNADFVGPDGPGFDFSDNLGDDGVLSPSEVSEPVTMVFKWPQPMPFVIGFRLDLGMPAPLGFIAGIVFDDRDGDGEFDPEHEPGIPGVPVELGPSPTAVSNAMDRRITDERGRYRFDHLRAGVYSVAAHGAAGWKPTTPNPVLVTLIPTPNGGAAGIDGVLFGFAVDHTPPMPLFGPVMVGPGAPGGTEFEGTFLVPQYFAPVDFFLRIVPPPVMIPLIMHIAEASVVINDKQVWSFVCERPDTTCEPSLRIRLDPSLIHHENKIRIRVLGDERSLLMFTVEAETILPPQ